MNKEIKWNIVNSLLAGSLVFLGSLSDGEITYKGICFALITAGVVAINKFKDYWSQEEIEYKDYENKLKAFNFI